MQSLALKETSPEQLHHNHAPVRHIDPVGAASPQDMSRQILSAMGNRAVQRYLSDAAENGRPHPGIIHSSIPQRHTPRSFVQTKLSVNTPGDVYEQEADRTADQVMRMPETAAQPECSCGGACDNCRKKHGSETLQMKPLTGSDTTFTDVPGSVHEVLRSSGAPLDPATRAFMEPRFGRDFSNVRIHSGTAAERSARSIGATAYTSGDDVVFGSNAFAPSTTAGKRLLAHELTHVVQQGSAPLQMGSEIMVQRQPALPGCLTCHLPEPGTWNRLHPSATDAKSPKHQDPNQLAFEGFHKIAVTPSNFNSWVLEKTWNDTVHTIGDRGIFRLLLRREDSQLNELWKRALHRAGQAIRGSHEFAGSNEAREIWVEYLAADEDEIVKTLNQRAVDSLVAEIKATLLSGAIPRGADFVKDPRAVAFIEEYAASEAAKKETAETGRGRVGVGFTWGNKRIVAVNAWEVIFEVIGHEGLYFTLSDTNFRKTDPFLSKVAEEVTKGTSGLRVVGSFIKGFLTALSSPVILAVDTGAKIVDMVSLATAAGVKWVSGKDIPYTCLSSTCQNFNACLKDPHKTSAECKRDAVVDAVEQATIIVPLYKHGAECLGGDAESCGAIAALAVGLVEEGGARIAKRGKEGLTPKVGEIVGRSAEASKVLSKAEMEDALIREAIDRPHEGDARVAEALEKPKKPAAPEPPTDVKALPRDEVASPRTEKDLATDKAVHESARQAGSQIKLSDSEHGLAAHGKGEEAGITMCSAYCALVRKELKEVIAALPEDYPGDTVRDLKYLAERAEGVDNVFRRGKITKEVADRASREIAAELQKRVRMDPNLDQLLQMSPEYLKANRARLKKELQAAKRHPKPAEKLPSPSQAEKEVGASIAANVRTLNPETNFPYQNRQLGTIAADLAERQGRLRAEGKGALLPEVNTSILDLGTTDFMHRHPNLYAEFDRLLQRAERERRAGHGALYEEVTKFLSEGRMRNRRPDAIEFRLETGEVSITDTTLKTNQAKALMHEFKTRFYGYALQDILGTEGPTVTAYEHNLALGIHRRAR